MDKGKVTFTHKHKENDTSFSKDYPHLCASLSQPASLFGHGETGIPH